MLVLSILLMLALAVAVASFFIASAQWLLFASAALVILAFYLSRRASRSILESDLGGHPAPAARERLTVPVDHEILESGRHRDPPVSTDRSDRTDRTVVNDAQPRSGTGRIAS